MALIVYFILLRIYRLTCLSKYYIFNLELSTCCYNILNIQVPIKIYI